MVLIDKFKTLVGRNAGSRAGNALTTSVGAAAPTFAEAWNHAKAMTSKLFEEREWQCPCGHKFRAAGEWVACAPIYCEVPSCPNPKYYVDGPGRALLEANPSGVKLEEVKNSGNSSSAGTSTGKKSGGVGSRFRWDGRWGYCSDVASRWLIYLLVLQCSISFFLLTLFEFFPFLFFSIVSHYKCSLKKKKWLIWSHICTKSCNLHSADFVWRTEFVFAMKAK